MAGYDRNVFINCPFDDAYRTEIFRALVFAVHDCGFQTRCALETTNAAESRISKIERIIEECQYGIHDLSRTELDPDSNLPRFNMPLELGLFLGAKRFGSVKQKRKSALVLDIERYRYHKFISDIAGQDISAHNGKTEQAIRRVRDWLKPNNPEVSIPGGQKMARRFESFSAVFPTMCAVAGYDDDPPFHDYVYIVCEWLKKNPT